MIKVAEILNLTGQSCRTSRVLTLSPSESERIGHPPGRAGNYKWCGAISMGFDPHRYGPDVAAILALDGSGSASCRWPWAAALPRKYADGYVAFAPKSCSTGPTHPKPLLAASISIFPA